MKTAIVVGSGAGGAMVAKELQGKFTVTILEAGQEFHPFSMDLGMVEKIKKTGLLFDEREIEMIFPTMKIRKTPDIVLVNGIGLGGTTTICAGNAIRMDGDLRALGIDLDAEFEELYAEVPISTGHQKRWRETTRRLFDICQGMGLDPRPLPKMGHYDRCVNCGRCVLGCQYGVKWDSRQLVQKAVDAGAEVVTGCEVERVVVKDGRVTGVRAKKGWTRRFYAADLVVLAAGGLATPTILRNSGMAVEPNLFVDPVLTVAAEGDDPLQYREMSMPWVVQRERFILSPYFDYLSFFFNKKWNHPARDIFGIMIKLADANLGSIGPSGVKKTLTAEDRAGLREGVELCQDILGRFGVDRERTFLGTVNAGHPGGMLPLTERERETFHHDHLPANLYVADATLIPRSLGNPPILTIMALAKRVSKVCSQL